MQIGQDIKRSRAYQIIQELQLMVCSRDNGIRGNAARARTMVLLKEVQGVLVGLENKIDSQTFDLGVLNVERTELRKELRDEKAREAVPFHTIDFRSTEVRELPHKLRTLFEDNQLLREQVRSLQYAVRSAESRLEAAERKAAGLELDNAHLAVALRDAGSSPDMAAAMRQQQEEARGAQARVSQLEQQVMALLEQLEADRALATQQAQRAATRQAALEAKLGAALGRAAATRLDAAGGGSGWMGEEEAVEEQWGRGGTVGRDASPGRQRSPAGFQRAYTAGGPGQSQRRGASGRDRSPGSPPRSPTGRSISHSPGSTIPTLYPNFNQKPRAPRGFTADSPTWHGNTGGGAAGAGAGGAGSPHLPNLAPASPSAAAPGQARPPSAGGGGGMHGPGGLEVLQEGRANSHTSSHGTATGPGEQVRAINSSAVLTSRPLLPQVSGGSANGGGGGSSSHGGGGSGTGMRQSSHTSVGPGILGLQVSGSMRRASSSSAQGGGAGAGGAAAAVAGGGGGGGSMQMLSTESSGARPPVSRSVSNTSASAGAAAAAATAGVPAAGGSVAGSEKGSVSGAAAGGATAGAAGGAEEATAPVAEDSVAGA
ncbi:hypothetical protein HXX76_007838 [Chlamydomonas incerta]|uniref:Uncharacterized protein n=1 Tax=Chlamydomonas incerta TaxID=51695 RepID=A0A835W303_CHLIN|nr:hypothetical protein HXX76_007838 [Chlamydomonas incerta]|eukprot:KAG2434111.1 hypothetical protein HXX76_007838 [Chlamydomonas incerta]